MSSTEKDGMFVVTPFVNATHDQTFRGSFGPATSPPVRYFVITDLLLIIKIIRAVSYAITTFGILSNICNIIVFVGLGVLETATSLTLFALSISDLSFLLILLMYWTLLFLVNLGVTQTVEAVSVEDLAYQFLFYFRMVYTLSELFTVYLAVQKCCCVALPFHFKLIFTPAKALATLFTMVIVVFACYAPLFFTTGLQEIVDMTQNTTRYIIWFSEDREIITNIFHNIVNLLVPTAGQVIVAVCLVVLTRKLRKTTKFRQASEKFESKDDGSKVGESKVDESKVKGSKVKDSSKLSGKELRAVQSVVVLVVMFIVCNLPTVLTQYVSYIEPEFNDFRWYGTIYALVGQLRMCLMVCCSSFNVFVYFTFNSSYRQQAIRRRRPTRM
ncbi:uncharacterized protein LOC101851149 [Aplysia californica]|uniref:Uncharacterized protein LOC101851149 n=1 Tax=Aplysia californica TaxID=6500 RepID=A0ABM0K495_APLCA|nr:uncharacterized protein LOC101851149 [Aplysia californica]